MQITRTGDTVCASLSVDEVDAIRDDLGGIRASEISAAGDEFHGLLEQVDMAGGA